MANWLPVLFSLNCRKDSRSERPPQREERERDETKTETEAKRK